MHIAYFKFSHFCPYNILIPSQVRLLHKLRHPLAKPINIFPHIPFQHILSFLQNYSFFLG